MRHARADYENIQDPSGRIPEEEPVFLLRGQDIVAPDIVEAWAEAAREAGASEALVKAAYEQAQAMRNWQAEVHQKVPDAPQD